MNKIITIAAVALFASVATVASASAVSPYPKLDFSSLYKKKPAGEITSPGDAFNPQTANVDVRAECEAQGGTPKRQFQDDGFVWTCVL